MKSNIETVKSLLKYTYGLVPIVAGLDKFTNLLTDWTQYISPTLSDMIPFDSGMFMIVVGVIEILAGVLVFLKTKIGALVVSVWLTVIALVLLLGGTFIDVAVRDLVMAIGAFALAKLSDNQSS
ncbi:hypothetical protein [Flagellimonas onchidii]|uniref:hypothetical protein n=1 Tax=Flagellimonas onchidii TaxID=2562684 RepID=UPI0010A5AA54|nr:hypothetical protein [Allomuricauda onchidii]